MHSDPGASPPANLIPLCVPEIRGQEWSYVKQCLDTNWVSYVGPYVDRFERELATRSGARFAVATSSGTAALHIALLLAGVGDNDEVVMPGLTFIAPAHAVRYCGAWPTFTDIRTDDWHWDVEQVAAFLAQGCERRAGKLVNRVTGRRIAALLPVHLLGGMGDVDAVAELASRYQLPIVEDAAECLGATFRGRPIGAPSAAYRGPFRLVITSFNGNKLITTGGGGAIFTDDEQLARHAKHLTTTAKAGKLEFFHDEIGYNYRLTNIAAAMGVAQLERLDEYVATKRQIGVRYHQAFSAVPGWMAHPEPRHCASTFWMYTLRLDREAHPLIDTLNAAGVMSRPLWQPLSRQPALHANCFVHDVSNCNELYLKGLSLPCSVGLTANQQTTVVAAVHGWLTAQPLSRQLHCPS